MIDDQRTDFRKFLDGDLTASEFIGIRLEDILLNNEDEAFGQSVNLY